ncbi:uncharacterized protein LOC126972228 [Leptidea sinapis]|uniref:uncharacterized protein LOC126972228 n=1 Tax=Leptidea sinapis TaxID=189913 RepID=UPI0021C3E84D|nr:uncharacterized protein LOC126972228 [Leptidea sinapis]
MGTDAASAVSAQSVSRLEAGWTLVSYKGRNQNKPRIGESHSAHDNTDRHRPNRRQRRIAARLRKANAQKASASMPSSEPEPQPSTSRGSDMPVRQARYDPRKAPDNRRPPSNKAGGVAQPSTSTKRTRLDDTNSPRGDHKRAKLLNRPKPTTYANAAKTDPVVAITSTTTGHIDANMAQLIQSKLEDKLMTAMMAAMNEDREGPAFLGKPVYDGGILKLWCSNLKTLEWLKIAVPEIQLPNGDTLAVKNIWEIPNRVRCGILLPGEWKDTKAIGGMLRFQNSWAKVDSWLLHALYHHNDHSFIVVSIPEDQIPKILEHERRLSFMLGSVYLKFQGPGGKYTETPPSKDTNGEASTTTGNNIDDSDALPEPMDAQAIDPADGNCATSSPSEEVLDSLKELEELLATGTKGDADCTKGIEELCIGDGEEGVLSKDGIPF